MTEDEVRRELMRHVGVEREINAGIVKPGPISISHILRPPAPGGSGGNGSGTANETNSSESNSSK